MRIELTKEESNLVKMLLLEELEEISNLIKMVDPSDKEELKTQEALIKSIVAKL